MRVLIAHASEASRGKLADAVTRGRRLALDVRQSDNGPETLDLLLEDDPPEVALIDWDLPGIEGPEMCRLVRDFHQHHDTWMIVLTPTAHRESASEVWRAGADDCVFTPAPAKLLSERVTKGLCEMAPQTRETAQPAEGPGETVQHGARPTLDAICRDVDEVREDEPVGLAPDLRATVDPEDQDESAADLVAGRVELAAKRVDLDDGDDATRGRVELDAMLART